MVHPVCADAPDVDRARRARGSTARARCSNRRVRTVLRRGATARVQLQASALVHGRRAHGAMGWLGPSHPMSPASNAEVQTSEDDTSGSKCASSSAQLDEPVRADQASSSCFSGLSPVPSSAGLPPQQIGRAGLLLPRPAPDRWHGVGHELAAPGVRSSRSTGVLGASSRAASVRAQGPGRLELRRAAAFVGSRSPTACPAPEQHPPREVFKRLTAGRFRPNRGP